MTTSTPIDDLARRLVEQVAASQPEGYAFEAGGFVVSVVPRARALREVDTTEYDESNAGEGPD
ncbi:MAG TPA: hypothetical protein VGN52_00245 [Burkholderiales bacterium]|jgi:hypothetical protein